MKSSLRSLFFVLLITSCIQASEEKRLDDCEGITLEAYVTVNETGGPFMSEDLIVNYPECANDLLAFHNITNVHIGTFEERREKFGPEWEVYFRREVCENRSWPEKPPSICSSKPELA
jgi:hypothetical protein